MTQSSKDKNESLTITTDTGSYTIDLNNTYGTTTTYITTGTDYYNINDPSIDWGSITIDGDNDYDNLVGNINIFDGYIDKDEIEKMCKEYPALEKVWRNFKSVYDMCKQDYEGKKKAGEIDDDIPF